MSDINLDALNSTLSIVDGKTCMTVLDIGAADGVTDVSIQDSLGDPLEWYFSRKIAATNLTTGILTPVNGDGDLEVTETLTITVDNPAGAVADETWIEIYEGRFKHQAQIIGVVGSVLTLATPIGFPFTTAAAVLIVDIEQNKNFSLIGIAPLGEQYYTIDPPEEFASDLHETRITVVMLHEEESDSSTYGDIQTGLGSGIILSGRGKVFASETGLPLDLVLFNNLVNIKTNLDWESTCGGGDVKYVPKSGNPSSPGLYGTNVRKTFNGSDKSGVVIPVRAPRNEATRALFRDDMSALSLHRVKVMGHTTIED